MAGLKVLVPWQASQVALEAMCVAVLPLAVVPLWQLAQPVVMPTWSNAVAGFQAAVLWQLSQVLLAGMWVAILPVAIVPLWQLKQAPMTCV